MVQGPRAQVKKRLRLEARRRRGRRRSRAAEREARGGGAPRAGEKMTLKPLRVAAFVAVAGLSVAGPATLAQSRRPPAPARATQAVDEEYTRLIKQNLQDPRITSELVDHLPASATVPTPLKFLGRAVGTPGELTYAKDIYRYYEALAKASPRAKYWKIGTTEEGRDIVLLAIADEATIKSIDKYR